MVPVCFGSGSALAFGCIALRSLGACGAQNPGDAFSTGSSGVGSSIGVGSGPSGGATAVAGFNSGFAGAKCGHWLPRRRWRRAGGRGLNVEQRGRGRREWRDLRGHHAVDFGDDGFGRESPGAKSTRARSRVGARARRLRTSPVLVSRGRTRGKTTATAEPAVVAVARRALAERRAARDLATAVRAVGARVARSTACLARTTFRRGSRIGTTAAPAKPPYSHRQRQLRRHHRRHQRRTRMHRPNEAMNASPTIKPSPKHSAWTPAAQGRAGKPRRHERATVANVSKQLTEPQTR
jgi:hypothetical protein